MAVLDVAVGHAVRRNIYQVGPRGGETWQLYCWCGYKTPVQRSESAAFRSFDHHLLTWMGADAMFVQRVSYHQGMLSVLEKRKIMGLR